MRHPAPAPGLLVAACGALRVRERCPARSAGAARTVAAGERLALTPELVHSGRGRALRPARRAPGRRRDGAR
eukprot:5312836-Lingulodinium_polyedra.AAC.1